MPNSRAYKAAEAMVRSFGVTCANKSVRQFICALEQVHLNGGLVQNIGKLRETVAGYYPNATEDNVERNLRTARDTILNEGDPERIREVLGHYLRRSLSVADLLDAIHYYMEREGLWPD